MFSSDLFPNLHTVLHERSQLFERVIESLAKLVVADIQFLPGVIACSAKSHCGFDSFCGFANFVDPSYRAGRCCVLLAIFGLVLRRSLLLQRLALLFSRLPSRGGFPGGLSRFGVTKRRRAAFEHVCERDTHGPGIRVFLGRRPASSSPAFFSSSICSEAPWYSRCGRCGVINPARLLRGRVLHHKARAK